MWRSLETARAWKTHLAGGLPPFLPSWVTRLGRPMHLSEPNTSHRRNHQGWGAGLGAGVHAHAIFIPRLPLPLSGLILSHKLCLPLPPPTPHLPACPAELGPRRDAIWPGLAAPSTSEWHGGDWRFQINPAEEGVCPALVLKTADGVAPKTTRRAWKNNLPQHVQPKSV